MNLVWAALIVSAVTAMLIVRRPQRPSGRLPVVDLILSG
jgi:hypothetical protein